MNARAVEIVDETPHVGPKNILDASLEGVPGVQVARMVARFENVKERLAIVFASFIPTEQRAAALTEAASRLTAPVACIVSNADGLVNLELPGAPSQSYLPFVASAAAAVLQYSWAWDESETVLVTCANERHRFRVTVLTDRTYRAEEVIGVTAA